MNQQLPSDAPFVLCPGQGAQAVGMGKAWFDQAPAAREIFAQADDVLGMDLTRLCLEGPEDQLHRTDVAQAAIYTTSVAALAGLQAAGHLDPACIRGVAGLSLGEFTALYVAGAYSFAEGLKLVRLRGQAMQQAADASASSMVALTGDVEEAKVVQLCDQGRGEGVLVPANYNSPMQVVVSGSLDACERAVALATQFGWKATPLSVAGAFHSPIMAPAAEKLAEALAGVKWQPLRVPVLCNVTGLLHDSQDAALVCQMLVQQLTSPVRWSQSMQWAVAHLPGPFVELAPGKVLSGLMRRIDRAAQVTSFDQPPA